VLLESGVNFDWLARNNEVTGTLAFVGTKAAASFPERFDKAILNRPGSGGGLGVLL
jgi:hypothetical protein